MNSGVGYLIGYLVSGWWFDACTQTGGTRWPFFWGGLSVLMAVALVYFLAAFKGTLVRKIKN